MRNYLIKSVLALVCLALVAMPLSAQKGKGGGGGGRGGGGGGSTGGTPCAFVTTPTLSYYTASPGMTIGVFGRVTNCSTGKATYTVTVSSTSSCGEETIIASPVISFSAGEGKLISSSYVIPPDTCLGYMTVSLSAYSGSTRLASESAVLLLQ